MAAVMAALGVAQMGLSVWQMLQAQKEKDGLNNISKPKHDPVAKRYEREFQSLADKSYHDRKKAGGEIVRNQTATQKAEINRITSNPITRARFSAAANAGSTVNLFKTLQDSDQLKISLTQQAARMGVTNAEMKRRVWRDLLSLQSEKQRSYDQNQLAWGKALNAGIHNTVGAFDSSNEYPDQEAYKMSREAYREAMKKVSKPRRVSYKEWKYDNFGK